MGIESTLSAIYTNNFVRDYMGSGCFVEPDVVLTAAHVVEAFDRMKVEMRIENMSGDVCVAIPDDCLIYDRQIDAALIKLDEPIGTDLASVRTNLEPWEDKWSQKEDGRWEPDQEFVLASPRFRWFKKTATGIYSGPSKTMGSRLHAYDPDDPKSKRANFDFNMGFQRIRGGMSGSPIFDDNGEVVTILSNGRKAESSFFSEMMGLDKLPEIFSRSSSAGGPDINVFQEFIGTQPEA